MHYFHQLTKEVDLRGQLEQLKGDLTPLEDQKTSLEKKSMSHSNVWMWGGMAFMSLQLGFLARDSPGGSTPGTSWNL